MPLAIFSTLLITGLSVLMVGNFQIFVLRGICRKFFLILRVLRAERDHKAALVAQKVPVVFHSKDNASSLSYMQHLTPYAYKFVEKQIQLKEKVKLHVVDDKFYAMSSEGRIDVSTSSCECSSWHSMKLPCRTSLLHV